MAEEQTSAPTWLDLYEWRQRVARMYRDREAALRAGEDPERVFQRFCAAKDALFKQHPQSPLTPAQRHAFAGLRYFAYDPAYRVTATIEPETEDVSQELEASGPHTMRFRRAARVRCAVGGTAVVLIIYWIDVYGGGLFLPFRDATSGVETYGGGRYLFDTVKGSDFVRLDAGVGGSENDASGAMGYAGGSVLLDFNYAYNPSCAYDARWVCPLSPPDNRLPLPIRAGELAFHD
jgi:uncharacterized protein (DUF1684 family)